MVRISAVTETRLWITHVVMPVLAIGALVYVNNKDNIHDWIANQRFKRMLNKEIKKRYST